GRQLPVAVSLAAREWTAVRESFDDEVVGEPSELARHHHEDAFALTAQKRAAAVEEARARPLDQLDPEPLGGDRELNLIAQRLELGHLHETLPDVLGRLREHLLLFLLRHFLAVGPELRLVARIRRMPRFHAR